MPRTLLAGAAVAICIALTAAPLAAAHPMATVRGAEAVNVRRSPGPEAHAFAMLPKGRRVAVESMSGSWALVVLESGERGYINVAYLDLPPGVTIPTAETPTVVASTSPEATATPSALVAVGVTPPIEEKLAKVLERVAALESVVSTPMAATERPAERPGETPLARSVEPLGVPAEDTSDLRDIGPALALAGVGFAVGFLLGAAYGQRQERNRRTRVRF